MKKDYLFITMACVVLSPIGNAFASDESLDAALKRIAQLEQENQLLKQENKQLHKVHSVSNAPRKNMNNYAAVPQIDTNSRIIKGDEKIVSSSRGFEGFYIGANGGYGGGELNSSQKVLINMTGYDQIMSVPNYDYLAGGGTGTSRIGGAVAGVQVGYNYYTWRNIILSGEADINWSDVSSTRYSSGQNFQTNVMATNYNYGPLSDLAANRIGLRWFGTVRARLGYEYGSLMPYITGGFAYAAIQSQSYDTNVNSSQHVDSMNTNLSLVGQNTYGDQGYIRTGWAAGAGLEYKVLNNWSLKSEYIFTSFGSFSDNQTISGNFINTNNYSRTLGYQGNSYGTLNIHQVRFGVNYHLDLAQAQSVIKAAY